MSEPDLTLPPGSRLVHIGFPKTGTTSVQGAMEIAREQMRGLGVIYPGVKRYHKHAGVFIAQSKPRRGDRVPTERDWLEVVEEIEDAPTDARAVISSEWLSEAPEDGVRRLVKDLGGERVHIVATLRPLVDIMPSAWQQYLQNGNRTKYDQWLTDMLVNEPYEWPTPSFWARHRHDEILTRWAEVAGAENVTAIIVDTRDHDKLIRQFTSLLALPAGVLQVPPERDNRSLRWPEAEVLRFVNQRVREEEWPDEWFREIVRLGVVEQLFTLDADRLSRLPKIGMPDWAAERASEIGAGFAANIGALGIRVIGDLESLGKRPPRQEPRPPAMLPPKQAADAIVAAIKASLEFGDIRTRQAQAEANQVKRAAERERQLTWIRRMRRRARRALRSAGVR
ncbi:MAG TPA: hypothetical protein VHV79_03055 [Mycobacteriales bacterium]|jgi:hypothetical protein|nr:hypothetical protein [Mycobacteriales bacterium]